MRRTGSSLLPALSTLTSANFLESTTESARFHTKARGVVLLLSYSPLPKLHHVTLYNVESRSAKKCNCCELGQQRRGPQYPDKDGFDTRLKASRDHSRNQKPRSITTRNDSWLLRMSTLALSVTHLRHSETERVEIPLPRFHVFDGASRIVIEAQSEEDLLCRCSEMGWELICACDC
jgi:hypothetical protein